MPAASRVYRTWGIDSRRWESFVPRPGDIVIATYPKCGTTWMQRIVGLLIFQNTDPLPLMDVSVWIDRRFGASLEDTLARADAQPHRRFFKSHLPADGLPLYDEVRYIHVARDGREACLSFCNHIASYTPWMLEQLDSAGLADETIARRYPRLPAEPAEFFHRWLTDGGLPTASDGAVGMSFFHLEHTWWDERRRENVLLVHYADLKADLAGEMRRIAQFLGIAVPDQHWPELVEAAGFEAMRRSGDVLLGGGTKVFRGGGDTFFHRGQTGRWRGVFRDDDLAVYAAKCAALPEGCARWLEVGRRSGAGAE